MQKLDETIGLNRVLVWHCNDAKDARGSKRDRHEHIGKGTIGLEPFRRVLNDPRTAIVIWPLISSNVIFAMQFVAETLPAA